MFDLFNETERPQALDPFTAPKPGLLETVGKSIMRGGAKTARAAALAVTPLVPWGNEEDPQAFLQAPHILPRKEDFLKFADETVNQSLRFWSTDPDTLTTSGRIVSALSELPLQLVSGGAGIIGSTALNTGAELVEQGVDPATATGVGIGAGAVTGGMVALPQAGRTLKETIGLVLSNPALGAAQDFATKKVLEGQGYEEQAKAFDPFDPAARSVDTVLGAVFGGIAHYGKWRAKAPTDVVDAVDVVDVHKQRQALNPFEDGKGHDERFDSAMESVTEGKPVDVSAHLPKPEPEPLPYSAERFRSDVIQHFGATEEKADALLALVSARAKVAGEDLDAYIGKRIAGVETGTDGAYSALYQDRPVVQPFYSKVLAEVEGLQQEKWNAPDLLAKLQKTPGVKAEELAWTGLDDFLQGKKSVTREEVRTFLQDNQVEIREVMKSQDGDIPFGAETSYGDYQLPGGKDYRELLLTLPHKGEGQYEIRRDGDAYLIYDKATQDYVKRYNAKIKQEGIVALYSAREAADYMTKLQENAKADNPGYRSSHWNEKNVLAHVRFNERSGADGSRVLHVEEVQSDWHQDRRAGKDVPDAPFSKSWPELTMKRVLRYAAEHGFDRVTWTGGEAQAERYDISRKLDEVTYRPVGDSWHIEGYQDGKARLSQRIADRDLNDAVGKELAQKIRSGEGVQRYPGTETADMSLKGLDLKVGGKGMKGFYDQILPNVVDKLGKKFGAKVETAEVADIGPQQSIPITERMRDALLYEGQPLFQDVSGTEKGAVSFLKDGRAIIHALEAPDFSTLVHEVGHLFRRDLPAHELRELDTWLFSQVPGAKWGREHEETFARAFEKYLAEGRAPAPELQGVFDKFKSWLLEIYKRITGTAIDVKMNDKVRAVFDRLLWTEPLKKDVPPEVRTARETVTREAAELAADLSEMTGEEVNFSAFTDLSTPDAGRALRESPRDVSDLLRDALEAEAAALESSHADNFISSDGQRLNGMYSTAAEWFINRNRELGKNPVSKESVINALRKTAQGLFDKLTPGQQDMVNAALDHLARQAYALHGREIDALELKAGDEFIGADLQRRVVTGERPGFLVLDNGQQLGMNDRLQILGDVRKSEPLPADMSPAELILHEQGDFQVADGYGPDGQEHFRSAREVLDEAKNDLAITKNRKQLYERAAFCMNLG